MQLFILIHTIDNLGLGPKSHHYKEVLLTLDTLVPVSPEDASSPQYGRWSSTSRYIGKEVSGKYYLRNINLSREETWTRTDWHQNPVSFFFDSSEKDGPFLVLKGMEPMNMKLSSGVGTFRKTFADQISADTGWETERRVIET